LVLAAASEWVPEQSDRIVGLSENQVGAVAALLTTPSKVRVVDLGLPADPQLHSGLPALESTLKVAAVDQHSHLVTGLDGVGDGEVKGV